jgi:hypothetical protein
MKNRFSIPRLPLGVRHLWLCAAMIAIGCAQGADLESPGTHSTTDSGPAVTGGGGAGGASGTTGTGGASGTGGVTDIGGASGLGGTGGDVDAGGVGGTGGIATDGAAGDDTSVTGGTGGAGGDVDASLPDGTAGTDTGSDVSVGDCSDLVKNGTETDVDCGGSCAPAK